MAAPHRECRACHGLGAGLGVALAIPVLRILAAPGAGGTPRRHNAGARLAGLRVHRRLSRCYSCSASGTAPAFATARVDLEAAMRSGAGRGTTGRSRLRSTLVVAELTLTVVLLVAAGLLLRSYANVLAVNPGFNPRNLLVAETPLPPSKYERGPAGARPSTTRCGSASQRFLA